ncbi:cytochrome c oxidase assembly protein [Pseudoroseicyclus aestuarii]|uniref:Cytochrome c oxidase assembly protein CtaG n=1 Tax=Pseudoroseicyclus aestuarii TaxID=1795041 RepID=A0A318SZ09_9RHOB|nr:cytochrome c oxidase assembly protein [Pseudoroseicyclus aestuarii]PYE84997.1 cytochrome c oxidase assembly protein subunit 11 [Pseudoroseicyclus aestuarii]
MVTPAQKERDRKMRRTALTMVGVVVFMGAMAWVAVPFYSWFCKVTGFSGTTGQVAEASDTVLDRTIKVRFDANIEPGMPWSFKPEQIETELRIGETGLAFYEAHNPTDHPVAGRASYNVTPYSAGGYFDKIQCFCFTEQVLQPGETVQMPVSFYVDPEIVNDREAKYVHTITLSYTFYEIEMPEDTRQAALTDPAAAAIDVN